MIRRTFLVFVLLLFPSISFADELVIEKGKGVEVCEAYLENIKNLTLQEMVCGEKPGSNDIKKPKWERLELKENKELVKKIGKFLEGGDQFAKVKIYDDEKEFEHYLNGPLKNSFIKIAEIDIDNDGKLEKALLYHARLCNIERRYYYARPLLVLDKAKNQIDVEKTEPLLQNPFPNNLQAKAVNHDYQLYDVILHKNIIYFDKWNARDWTVIIYKLAKNETKEICKYKYIFDKPLIKEDY